MGNRAMVFFEDESCNNVGVYLHWNGGPESVAAFVQAMNDRNWTRLDYAPARLCQIVGEFFDQDGSSDGLSLGVYQADYSTAMRSFGLGNAPYLVRFDGDNLVAYQRDEVVRVAAKERDRFDGIVKALKDIREKRKAAA